MIPNKKVFIASLVVGGIGAAIGGFGGYAFGVGFGGPDLRPVMLPAGLLSGFLACSLASIWYLEATEHRSRQQRLVIGPLFGGLAGGISGALTFVSGDFALAQNQYYRGVVDVYKFVGDGVLGFITGGFLGVVIGLIFTVLVGSSFFKAAEEPNVLEKTLVALSEYQVGALCYALGWLSGLVFLLTKRQSRFVRFHALQSMIVFGVMSIAWWAMFYVPWIHWVPLSRELLVLFGLLSGFVLVLGLVVWVLLMRKANQGKLFKLPVAGHLADRWAG